MQILIRKRNQNAAPVPTTQSIVSTVESWIVRLTPENVTPLILTSWRLLALVSWTAPDISRPSGAPIILSVESWIVMSLRLPVQVFKVICPTTDACSIGFLLNFH